MDDFPYKKYSIKDPIELFKNAQKYGPRIERRGEIMRLPGVTSKISWGFFKNHFPLTFKQGSQYSTIVISTPKWAYNAINILPDYYTEYARVRDIGAYQDISPYDYWQKHKESIMNSTSLTSFYREELYKRFPKEARQGKITNYLALFKLLNSKKVLDPSAAWGDRMIAALASPYITHYTGYDPHSRIAPGWREILRDLQPVSGKDPKNFVFINKPFEPETTNIINVGGDTTGFGYDLAIISQPPFIGDLYDIGNPDQAREKYKTMPEYIEGFLKVYLKKASEALKIGGYMCMTVLDRKDYQITELQLAIVEIVNEYMHYQGAVFWQGDGGSIVPWWIFQRKDHKISKKRLEETQAILANYDVEYK